MMMNRFHKLFLFVLLSVLTAGLISCDDGFITDTSGKSLSFSQDTLTFDTVFTTIGSATSKVLVYNPHNKALRIDHISLAGGGNSSFRINVDGAISSKNTFDDITIRAKDSMYIFIELNINPQDINSPVFITDSIVFNYGNAHQRIVLEAYGQNMEPLRNLTITSDTILTAVKPYLIYGDLTVDSAMTLTLLPGCKLYFHNNANLVVLGNLRAEGTFEDPIVLRGDRLDNIKYETPVPYKYVAGQWGSVLLISKQGNHVLKHVNISSGYVGVFFSNDDVRYKPKLTISNSVIHNSLLYNLVAVNGDLRVENSEISNSGSYTVYLNGGKHEFYHCTITNYLNTSSARPVNRDSTAAVMIMDLNRSLPMETVFQNCIISGTSTNEFILASKYQNQYHGDIRNSYIRRSIPIALPIFNDVYWYQKKDTVFKNANFDIKTGVYFDFTPDSVSPARGLADPVIAAQFPLDLHGNDRLSDGAPDAGAYEWFPTVITE